MEAFRDALHDLRRVIVTTMIEPFLNRLNRWLS
jgi:hypothetical protein